MMRRKITFPCVYASGEVKAVCPLCCGELPHCGVPRKDSHLAPDVALENSGTFITAVVAAIAVVTTVIPSGSELAKGFPSRTVTFLKFIAGFFCLVFPTFPAFV